MSTTATPHASVVPQLVVAPLMGRGTTKPLWAERGVRILAFTIPPDPVRDRWPAAVRPGALAELSSNSGNTEETLALAKEAAARKVACVAMASGGALAREAAALTRRSFRCPVDLLA